MNVRTRQNRTRRRKVAVWRRLTAARLVRSCNPTTSTPPLGSVPLRSAKSDAAKASLSLASQAETPAAKLLLARNAFQLYMKGGDYDAADAALDAMLAAVPDYPADELQELLEKALYPVPSKKAPQIRARVAALKQKAAAATQLKKVLALLEKTPDDPALNLRLGSVYALQNDWKRAAPAFAKGSDAALAKAAKAELDLEISPAKAADLYWSVELPKKDAQLQSSLRAHAADLYKLSLPDLTGLTKVQAERRIKETESAAESARQEKPAIISSRKPYTSEITYLESTGTQYIDTGIAPSPAISETAVFEAVVPHVTYKNCLYGTGNDVGSKTCGICCNRGQVTYWNAGSFVPSAVPYEAAQKYEIHRTSTSPQVNGKEVKSNMGAGASSELAYYLFARHNTQGAPDAFSSVRLYSYRVESGGKPILDLVPVRVGRVGHLFDKVSQKLFSNKGEGAFVLGKDKR